MVFINEWLPNPVGPDDAGEFIEFWNGGTSTIKLDGWSIQTSKGKNAPLDGRSIAPRGYLVLRRADAKFALVNADGGLLLYGPGGRIEDSASFHGAAQEGKSFSRADIDPGPASHFAWAPPTPGAPNLTPTAAVATSSLPYGAMPGKHFTAGDFLAIMIGTAAFVTGAILYIIKRHEDLSKLFSERNRKNRGNVGKDHRPLSDIGSRGDGPEEYGGTGGQEGIRSRWR